MVRPVENKWEVIVDDEEAGEVIASAIFKVARDARGTAFAWACHHCADLVKDKNWELLRDAADLGW